MTPPRADLGLLILRLGMGLLFVVHGQGKFFGGPAKWEKLGGAMKVIGVEFLPTLWGLLAASSEFVGGILIALGLFTRPAAAMMAATMAVAALVHLDKGEGLGGASHALEAMSVFVGLCLIGPGALALDARLRRR